MTGALVLGSAILVIAVSIMIAVSVGHDAATRAVGRATSAVAAVVPVSNTYWRQQAAKGPITSATADHASEGDDFIFTVRLPQRRAVRVEGRVKRGAVTITDAHTLEDVTARAPVQAQGNSHFDLHPVWLSDAERRTAAALLRAEWERHNRNTLEEWMAHHVEHGTAGSSSVSWMSGRSARTISCDCGEHFQGPAGPEGWAYDPPGLSDALSRAHEVDRRRRASSSTTKATDTP